MENKYVEHIAAELSLGFRQVQATAALIEEGATVPFIARYRKEATGSLDEVAIAGIRDRLAQLAELDKRRAAILKSLEEQGVLTDELKAAVNAAESLTRAGGHIPALQAEAAYPGHDGKGEGSSPAGGAYPCAGRGGPAGPGRSLYRPR